MQSRMDKYSNELLSGNSRTKKNQQLYETVKNSEITNFNVNSNETILNTSGSIINVEELNKLLEKKYKREDNKNKSLYVDKKCETEKEEINDTKEYDLNAILKNAKEGKSVDYNKERLRQVREAQFDILKNLDLEQDKMLNKENKKENKEAEKELMELINTITELELKNKELVDQQENQKEIEQKKVIEEDKDTKEMKNTISKIESTKEEKIEEETMTKLNIDYQNYDEFKDISKGDKTALFIKIIIFILLVALILGGVYILNNILDLGLF